MILLYTDMNEKYIPYLKPEDLLKKEDGNLEVKKIRKLKLKDSLRKVINYTKIQKMMKKQYKNVSNRLHKEDIKLTKDYNNLMDVLS